MRPATHQISPERQSMLDEAMAQIAEAFPERESSLEKLQAALIRSPNFKYIEMGEDA